MVLAAADEQPGTKSRWALEELARAYWYPLYAYIRRQGHQAAEAEEINMEGLYIAFGCCAVFVLVQCVFRMRRHNRPGCNKLATVALSAVAGLSCVSCASLPASTLRRPSKNDSYTITSVIQVLNPVNPVDMNDDFQDVRILSRDADSCTLEITYYPLYHPSVGENPQWRLEDAAMTDYLRPTPTENWDDAMQRDLVAELKRDGIDVGPLTDRQLVEQVSRWAMQRARSTGAFAIWAVYYPQGKPVVFPQLRAAFDREKPDKTWTDAQMFEQETLGKTMFYNKIHGSCTSASVYLATILRALGIPTRIIFCIPPFDPNDEAQARLFYDNVRHHGVRETVRAALDGTQGFENHLFNEVYVGHHWVRLNYDRLGQPILDRHYSGLLTHIYTSSDLSQAPLAQTWGMRYFRYPADQPKLSSVNPYRLIAIHDQFGAGAHVDNPEVPRAELRTVTIDRLYPKGSPYLTEFIRTQTLRDDCDFLISCKERVDAVRPMRAFCNRAGHEFLLTAPGHPPVKAHLTGLTCSDEKLQVFAAQIAAEDKAKFVPGVAYELQPLNTSDTYRWAVAPGVTLLVSAEQQAR
jgi:hypothetical protein